jgi:hypothetical protein
MNMSQRQQLNYLALDLVRRAKAVNAENPSCRWESPTHGEHGCEGLSLLEFLFARHPNTVHRALMILLNPED